MRGVDAVRTLWLALVALGAPLPAAAQSSASLGLDYSSDYFWRGFSFYGDADSARGVFFPWASYSWKDFSLSVVGEVPEATLVGTPNTTEKAWTGVDFILSYSTSLFRDRLDVGSRAAYFLYPNSPHENPDGARNDFIDLGAWLQLPTVPLRPKLEYSQYFRLDDHDGEQTAFGDIYLRFSLQHVFEPLQHLMLTTTGSVAYFWYPSSRYWNNPSVGGYGDDYRGLSDIVGSVRASTDVWPQLTPYASLNVGVAPDRDFSRVWGKEQHVHVWVGVGVSYQWSLDRARPSRRDLSADRASASTADSSFGARW